MTTHDRITPQPMTCLHCDCELSTVNFFIAAPSRLPTSQASSLAGGGSLPASRCQRRNGVTARGLPAVKLSAHDANERQPPVFPPRRLAAVSSGM